MSNADQTFQRCPHDRENPYTMISRDLIRDKSISPECRWLIIYLLSNEGSWKIHIREIVNHCEGLIGRNRIYEIVNEAIEAGYMKREKFLVNGLTRQRYYVSEVPKFKNNLPPTPELKKCLRHPGFRDTENQYGKEVASVSFATSTASPLLAQSEPDPGGQNVLKDKPRDENIFGDNNPQDLITPQALKLTQVFASVLLGFNPKASVDGKQAAEVFASMLSNHPSVEVEDACAAVRFAFESNYWEDKILNANAFSKKFSVIYNQMLADKAKRLRQQYVKENKGVVKKIRKRLKEAIKSNEFLDEDRRSLLQTLKNLWLEEKFVQNIEKGDKIPYGIEPKEFAKKLSEVFSINFWEKNEP